MIQALLIAIAADMILTALPSFIPQLEQRLPLGGSHTAQAGSLVLVSLGAHQLVTNLPF